MNPGSFITFEGGEGGGKSTQVRRLAERLKTLGRDVVTTREPGGSQGAEALRGLLVTGAVDRWSPLSEALILYAARCDHVERLIRPSLAQGRVVICDRFFDSTRAYQGAAGGVDPNFIRALEQAVVAETRPELTLILDLDPQEGLERAGRRGTVETRFEDKGLSFHHRLRDEFLKIAAAEPERCVLIDAAKDVDVVESAVWSAVTARTSLLEAT